MEELNGSWLLGVIHERELGNRELRTCHELEESGIRLLTGEVPGNYEIDLEREGLIPDPFFGKNLLEEREREMNHLFYGKRFSCSPEAGKSYSLRFDGIDTVSDVYLNGVLRLHTDSMLVPCELELRAEELIDGDNELLVHIFPVAVAARAYDYPFFLRAQKYEADGLYIRKSAYMFGWDIFPRMLSGGIWRSVSFFEKPAFDFLQTYLVTESLSEDHSLAALEFFYELELQKEPCSDFRVELSGQCGGSSFFKTQDVWSKAGRLRIELRDPVLWWPRRQGEPKLYELTARLLRNGSPVCEKKFRAGIRTIRLEKTSLTDERHSGEFCFYVNGRRTFILGTNWVPLDSLPSRGKARIQPALAMAEDLNCNMIRCWGGGYYEDDEFYERCDEAGILVWQDFMEACGNYPEDDDFLKRYEQEVVYQIRRLRQHPCLALWSGDNENDAMTDRRYLNPNHNRATRVMIPQAIRMNDYVREYLPSSPYVDERAYAADKKYLPENHLWGPRDYYKGAFYRDALAHFASETGYHGCNSVNSIRKFISGEALWPYQNNGEWLLHASSPTDRPDEPFAYRIELMAKQIRVLFGRDAENLEEFSLLSQISQAEAKKYFIERFRIEKWFRTGIIWWNLLDGCPQFSDAVVDYYFEKKLAYDYIRRSQQTVALMCGEPDEKGFVRLMGVNDCAEERKIRYRVTDVTTGALAAEGEASLPGDSAVELRLLDSASRSAFFRLDWESEGEKGSNHYVSWAAPFDKERYLSCAAAAGCRLTVGEL